MSACTVHHRLFIVFNVASSVDMVELAKIMEMVLDVVKRHSSHSSEIFWRDVGDLGAMLFGERQVFFFFFLAVQNIIMPELTRLNGVVLQCLLQNWREFESHR